jgi:aerobic carbon-monoxide dehydrogenase small subunit
MIMLVSMKLNGRQISAEVEPRMSLADFVRSPPNGYTSVHLGCEHGVCGACTLLIDEQIARSCITLAISCEGANVRTVEGLGDDSLIEELKKAFRTHHGVQCGFCTPAMLITAREIIARGMDVSEEDIRLAMSGNICRCTGYSGIVAAILAVMDRRTNAPSLQTPEK